LPSIARKNGKSVQDIGGVTNQEAQRCDDNIRSPFIFIGEQGERPVWSARSIELLLGAGELASSDFPDPSPYTGIHLAAKGIDTPERCWQ